MKSNLNKKSLFSSLIAVANSLVFSTNGNHQKEKRIKSMKSGGSSKTITIKFLPFAVFTSIFTIGWLTPCNANIMTVTMSSATTIDTTQLDSTNNFNPNQRTFFLIHGWNSKPDDNLKNVALFLNALYPNANIIKVDWSAVAASWSYPYVAGQVPWVADTLARKINSLGIDTTQTTFVGHSLGAHISGFTSGQLQRQYNKNVKQVVGLDAAAPFWQYYDPTGTGNQGAYSAGLNKGQAQRVVAIHSSNSACAAGYGNNSRIGDMDIYLRRGNQVYGGNCFMPQDHSLAVWTYQYMAERLLARPKTNDYTYAKGYAFSGETGATFPPESYTKTMQFFDLNDSALQGAYTLDVSAQFSGQDGNSSYRAGDFKFPNKSGQYYSDGSNHYCQRPNSPDQDPGSFNGNVLGGYYSMTYDGFCDGSKKPFTGVGPYKFDNKNLLFWSNGGGHYCLYDSWNNFTKLAPWANGQYTTVHGDMTENQLTYDVVCGG
ncbi:hypothetical protein HW132_04080 [Brasilonema sp. CT11]|nr:hypothetical protein [Brasilonema sp. CT11]